jgi:hypothetical protein
VKYEKKPFDGNMITTTIDPTNRWGIKHRYKYYLNRNPLLLNGPVLREEVIKIDQNSSI